MTMQNQATLRRRTVRLTRIAAIAGLYVAITYLLAPISFGPIQFRLSETLAILPIFGWEYVAALTVGVFFGNIPGGPVDMVVGTLATLIAAVLTRLLRKAPVLPFLPPIIVNALMVPIIFLTIDDITSPYWLNVLTVGFGQTVVIFTAGVALYLAIKRNRRLYGMVCPDFMPITTTVADKEHPAAKAAPLSREGNISAADCFADARNDNE